MQNRVFKLAAKTDIRSHSQSGRRKLLFLLLKAPMKREVRHRQAGIFICGADAGAG
jgi:hypothetical protein